jgi:GxxExxY protein
MITKNYVNRLSYQIVGCAIEVHKHLGPGLLESVYHVCMLDELKMSGIEVQSQVHIPIQYKTRDLGGILKLDFLINDLIVIEIKAVDIMIPLYKAQLLSYLKLADKPKGLLINFHCDNITNQLVPMVTEKFASLPEK